MTRLTSVTSPKFSLRVTIASVTFMPARW